MIILPDPKTENIMEPKECSDTNVEKEKLLVTEDYKLAKMKISLESVSSDKDTQDRRRRK